MSKVMKAMPMRDLVKRIAGEWTRMRSIFGIPEAVIRPAFELAGGSPGFDVMGTRVPIPVGPAAGPHTQIAPNMAAAFLTGGGIFELKTVQKNDSLDIEKPCIDALDEGCNVEWSTELSLADAKAEYLRAWMLLHVLEAVFAPAGRSGSPAAPASSNRPFLFNLSVGYTLEGIRSPGMDAFIEGMRSPAADPLWGEELQTLAEAVRSDAFRTAFGGEAAVRARAAADAMPADPVHSVTLSTMHGCPPEEIERIGQYLIGEKRLFTWIKLNPTLLGFDRVRGIMDRTGWKEVILERPTFEKDLQFDDALRLVESLTGAAADAGVRFGIKLSNTLACVNNRGRLPGGEMYLSGRALFPVTTRLAAELARTLPAAPPFSFCAGVSALNAGSCIAAGLGPLTSATDLLKPGGYLRLEPMARTVVEALGQPHPPAPDAAALEALAVRCPAGPRIPRRLEAGQHRDREASSGLRLFRRALYRGVPGTSGAAPLHPRARRRNPGEGARDRARRQPAPDRHRPALRSCLHERLLAGRLRGSRRDPDDEARLHPRRRTSAPAPDAPEECRENRGDRSRPCGALLRVLPGARRIPGHRVRPGGRRRRRRAERHPGVPHNPGGDRARHRAHPQPRGGVPPGRHRAADPRCTPGGRLHQHRDRRRGSDRPVHAARGKRRPHRSRARVSRGVRPEPGRLPRRPLRAGRGRRKHRHGCRPIRRPAARTSRR